MEKVTLIKIKRGRSSDSGWVETRYPTAQELREFFTSDNHWLSDTILTRGHIVGYALKQAPYRETRKGKKAITEGPLRGFVYKGGADYRTALPYLFVWNPSGELVFKSWPEAGGWAAPVGAIGHAEIELYSETDPIWHAFMVSGLRASIREALYGPIPERPRPQSAR